MTQPTDICPYCRQSYTDWDEHKAHCHELRRMRSFSYPSLRQREPESTTERLRKIRQYAGNIEKNLGFIHEGNNDIG